MHTFAEQGLVVSALGVVLLLNCGHWDFDSAMKLEVNVEEGLDADKRFTCGVASLKSVRHAFLAWGRGRFRNLFPKVPKLTITHDKAFKQQ
jgi:hypothetical protein